VLLLIFSRLWKAVAADGGTGMFTVTSLIWYLAITEWITLSAPATYLKIEEDVRRGDIAYSLTRPASYLSVRLAEGAGEMFVRLCWLAVVGFLAAYFMSGGLPADPRGLLLAIPVGLLASVLTLLFQVGIGLSAFWIQEAAPVFWIWQKLTFVFGGLLFPLDIYPDWLRGFAEWTPFAPMIYGCGRMAFGFEPAVAAGVAGQLLVWILVTYLGIAWMFRRALVVVNVNGG